MQIHPECSIALVNTGTYDAPPVFGIYFIHGIDVENDACWGSKVIDDQGYLEMSEPRRLPLDAIESMFTKIGDAQLHVKYRLGY